MTAITSLKDNFSGIIITPKDANYTTARTSYMTTGAPAAIAYPVTKEDCRAIILFATHNHLVLSVRSGGHNGLDYSTNDGGILIDMSHFSGIELLDKKEKVVRVGAGARWGDVGTALAPHDLVISAGDTASVGVGGLTVGGGIGIMVRKFGLAIDQLVGAEIITADGTILYASKTENSDLFWALRGGGGNFGVVTHFDFQAHHLKNVFFGPVTYQITDLRQLLLNWGSASREASDEVTTTLVLMPGFNGRPPAAQLLYCFAGDNNDAHKKALEPFLEIAPVIEQHVSNMPYYETLQEAHPPAGVVPVVKDGILNTIDQDTVDIITSAFTDSPNRMMFLRSLGGASSAISPEATAFAHRKGEALIVCAAFLPSDSLETEKVQAMNFFDDIGKKCDGAYSNFFTLYDEHDLTRMYPPKTLEQLRRLKQQYDPENLFSRNVRLN